jgi:hypothetical protein
MPRKLDSPQLCVFIDKYSQKSLCLGKIGALARFCIPMQMSSYNHCRIANHALVWSNPTKTKFFPQVNHYYPMGSLSHGQPTAMMDPSIHANNVLRLLLERFIQGVYTLAQWTDLFYQALVSNTADKEDNKEVEEGDDPKLSQALDGVERGNGRFDLVFGWEEDIKMSNMEETGNKEWGPSICAHWMALELLRDAVSQAYHDRAKFESSIEGKVSMEVRAHLGILD